jgi:hypothetical protein
MDDNYHKDEDKIRGEVINAMGQRRGEAETGRFKPDKSPF